MNTGNIKDMEVRTYGTKDGYVNAIRQLTKQGYNYFLPIQRRRGSKLVIGKITMPRSRATLH